MKPETQKIIMYAGIGIGVLGGLAGMAVGIAANPIFGSIFALVFILIFGFAFGPMLLRGRKRKQLLAAGLQANAQITEIWDTGVTINNQPQIGIKLQVSPSTGMPYMAETKLVISRLETSYYQPGITCIVRYDPNSPEDVAIESIGGGMSSSSNSFSQGSDGMAPAGTFAYGMSQVEAEKKMREFQAENESILVIGREAKAIITRYEWMGVFLGADNPAVIIDVQVMPDNEPAFAGTCRVFLQASSVPKYQPGKQIWVKYDESNKKRVTVSRSS